MPVTAIDPKVALVVIDLQKGIVSMQGAHSMQSVVHNAVRLADAFREQNLPVVLVRVEFAHDNADAVKTRNQAPPPSYMRGPDFFEYIDELNVDPSRDILVQKRQWGAFYGTDLDLQLRRRGITNIVLCGVSTSIGVESTARDAWERSYNLTFASDAMTDTSGDAHERSVNVIFPRIGEIGTTAEILAKLP